MRMPELLVNHRLGLHCSCTDKLKKGQADPEKELGF
jgi:hypothetical protein